MVSVQLSLFNTAAVIKPTYTAAVIKPTYKAGDRVRVKRKTAHAPLLKKGDIVRIEAIHPHNGSCKFWNELTESWGYLYPDEFVVLPPGEVDSPTPAEVDSPTPAEVAVGESNCLHSDSDYLDPISTYKPRGTARGDGDYRYYRLSYKEGNKVRQVHIRGGNTDSPIAQAKVAEVRSLLASGLPPAEIARWLRDSP